MNFKSTLAASAAALALVGGIAAAQEITGSIRGTVTDEAGAPLAGATIVVTDANTGFRRSVTTGSAGEFTIRSLNVAGSYSVSASSTGYEGERVDNLGVSLGETTTLSFDLASATDGDVIVVVGTASVAADLAVGPNATFGLETLASAPAINRTLTDILRIDPRVYVDEANQNEIQCAGKNNRYNSLTVDGVRMNDNFGLNANGYPGERIPFSFDAIEQVSIELAPFDVQYGGFSACNVNAVTKSGSNSLSGYAFVDYTNDGLRADSLEGDSIETGEFDEYRYGLGLGGPIIKDKLFFFAAYEKLEGVNLFDRGPIGSGAVTEVEVTQAELDEIAAIARDIYGYDPGGIPDSADNEDEKLLIKLDWNITDRQRASFTYNYNDGFNIVESDGDSNEFEFANHLYERGAEFNSYVGSLYSDWTDNFSTELRIGYSELDNRQLSLGGTDFGEITIELGDDTPEASDDVFIYLGGDDSRQANKLKYETINFALKGFYTAGDHDLTFGFERETIDVFNLFIQHVETEIDFDGNPNTAGAFDPAIENFRLGLADNVDYNNSVTGTPADAAAVFEYSVNTLFVQDEYDFGNGFTLTGGLRYDWYTTDDKPDENAIFEPFYGFSNAQTIDGEGILQPRIGATWEVSPTVTLQAGFGIYSGGNPNVWLSNTYQATNTVQFGASGGDFGLEDGVTSLLTDVTYGACEDGVPTGPGYCVPQDLIDAVNTGTGSNFEINYLDPNFDIPSDYKVSLGGTFLLPNDFVLTADVLYSVLKDSAVWLRGDLEQDGTTTGPDGGTFPTFDGPGRSSGLRSFVLTNADEDAKSLLLSAGLSKSHDNGVDWSLGYAYSDAQDVHPMNSSVAFSNYIFRAFTDPQTPEAALSDYNIAHRFTGFVNYEKEFFGNNPTRFSAYGHLQSGRPYSIVYDGDVSQGSIFGFNPFTDGVPNALYPGFERNDQESSWWGKVDVKVEQAFTLPNDHTASAFIIVDNFTNLLSDEWGIMRQSDNRCVVGDSCETRQGDPSRYEIRFGARYEF